MQNVETPGVYTGVLTAIPIILANDPEQRLNAHRVHRQKLLPPQRYETKRSFAPQPQLWISAPTT